jgi:hypothetical protein
MLTVSSGAPNFLISLRIEGLDYAFTA